jgi:hypothetical protein
MRAFEVVLLVPGLVLLGLLYLVWVGFSFVIDLFYAASDFLHSTKRESASSENVLLEES